MNEEEFIQTVEREASIESTDVAASSSRPALTAGTCDGFVHRSSHHTDQDDLYRSYAEKKLRIDNVDHPSLIIIDMQKGLRLSRQVDGRFQAEL